MVDLQRCHHFRSLVLLQNFRFFGSDLTYEDMEEIFYRKLVEGLIFLRTSSSLHVY